MQNIQREPSVQNRSLKKDPSSELKITQTEPTALAITLNQSNKNIQQSQYKEQCYRWVIIILVSIAFTINNLANNAIIPILSKIAKVYELNQTYANLPIQVSFLINPIMNFTAGHFIDSKGLGISFRIGAVLYMIGLLGFCFINYGYHWVLIGAILIALGQPLIMNCPAKVATFWFIDRHRTVATGIISAINLITLGVSLVFPVLFVKQDSVGDEAKNQIFGLYSGYFLAGVANTVLIMFFMRQKPQKLPSAGAQQKKTSISQTYEIIKGDKNIWKFFIAAVMLYGTFLSFGSTSNMLFKPYGYQDSQIAIFGVCLLFSGIVGSILYTVYIKKTIKYRNAIICACTLAIVFTSTNALLMNFATNQRILISFMILGMGGNLVPMVPISYDLGCQLTFPVGEAQIVGIVTGGAMLYTVVLTLTISSAVGFGTRMKSAICMIIYIVLSLIGAILYCTVDIHLKRREHEQKLAEQKKAIGQEVNDTINDSAKDSTLIRPLNKKKQESEQIITIQQQNNNDSMLSQEKEDRSDDGKLQHKSGQESPQKLSMNKKQKLNLNFLKSKNIKVSSSSKNFVKPLEQNNQSPNQQIYG